MNKFKEAQQELLEKIDTKFEPIFTKLSDLEEDIKSLKVKDGWKDRFILLLGFVSVALVIYFGFNH